MRGDFSSFWNKEEKRNFNGVLHQQGRVLLDRDWNTQTDILNDWQETAAQDIIGAGVAAIPADAKDSFKVTRARVSTTPAKVEVWVNQGRVWADGLLIDLNENVVREAIYLAPPIQKPQAQIPTISPNSPIRDAVILEAWHEELSAFQEPKLLLEPALGGVDTTERVHTAFRFRLYRMQPEDTCDSIIKDLKDKFDQKGKLTVTLQPDASLDKNCPVVSDGGYTGFEHQLYRVEIAKTGRPAETWFKWSQFNGGLVGRGTFDSADRVVKIEANSNAIRHSGLNDFYLETLEFDTVQGFWQVTFGAKVKLDAGTNTLKLPPIPQEAADVFAGSVGAMDSKNVFFRLWNGIREVGEFQTAEKELQDGIFFKFNTAPSAEKYTPHDFWTFQVRADDVENNQVEIIAGKPTLINNKPPQGIFYHRVPLAELNWRSSDIKFETEDIEDCRRIFQPLTKLSGCCTYRVGDGVTSHGDFTRIQEAIDSLPKAGGKICVLPGEYRHNVLVQSPGNRNITIEGCGSRSHIIVNNGQPAIHVRGGVNVSIESLKITARNDSAGILLEGDEIVSAEQDRPENAKLLRNINLEKLYIKTVARCAIEMHVGRFVSIRGCQIAVSDVDEEWAKHVSGGKIDKKWAAVYLAGDDLLFENNEIRVLNPAEVGPFVNKVDDLRRRAPAQRATGGLHLSGGCERVRVINNQIVGGTGNGINLGSVDLMRLSGVFGAKGEFGEKGEFDTKKLDGAAGEGKNEVNFITVVRHEPWDQGKNYFPNKGYIEETDFFARSIAGAPLRDVWIEHNRIFSMGRNGIGVDAFFGMNRFTNAEELDLTEAGGFEFISIENLTVVNNRIEFCNSRSTVPIPETMTKLMGYGGIALSMLENLVVRDNFINDNGVNYLEPVCGIYLLHGEGIEISRNRITNNGRLREETSNNVKNGVRGGVVIMHGFSGSAIFESNRKDFSLPNGVPALKLDENIVSVPSGPSLMLIAIGNVSVVGNQFLRQTMLGNPPLWEVAGANVLIGNLSVTPHFYQAAAGFKKMNEGDTKNKAGAGKWEVPLKQLFGGSTIFAHNQCHLIKTDGDDEISAISSILIVSLDDIAFLGNNVSCTLRNNFVVIDTVLVGATVRASDNHWHELFGTVALSALTFGVMNTTTDNHSSHCLWVLGRLFVNRYNLTFQDLAHVMSMNMPGDMIYLDRSSDYRSPCDKGRDG